MLGECQRLVGLLTLGVVQGDVVRQQRRKVKLVELVDDDLDSVGVFLELAETALGFEGLLGETDCVMRFKVALAREQAVQIKARAMLLHLDEVSLNLALELELSDVLGEQPKQLPACLIFLHLFFPLFADLQLRIVK